MYPKQLMKDFYAAVEKGEVTILDVREPNEFAMVHIPGSTNFPLSGFPDSIETLDKEKTYHILCQAGPRAVVASDFLSKRGIKVVCVQGGISSWPGKLVGY